MFCQRREQAISFGNKYKVLSQLYDNITAKGAFDIKDVMHHKYIKH